MQILSLHAPQHTSLGGLSGLSLGLFMAHVILYTFWGNKKFYTWYPVSYFGLKLKTLFNCSDVHQATVRKQRGKCLVYVNN